MSSTSNHDEYFSDSDDPNQPCTSAASAPHLDAEVAPILVPAPPPKTSYQGVNMPYDIRIVRREIFEEMKHRIDTTKALGKTAGLSAAIQFLIHGPEKEMGSGEIVDEFVVEEPPELKREELSPVEFKPEFDDVMDYDDVEHEEKYDVDPEDDHEGPGALEEGVEEGMEIDVPLDPLDAALPLNTVIDTKELAAQINNELRKHLIPQTTFAEQVLRRRQGTLSDLLRNPKSWDTLRGGKDTYLRMYNWLNMPFEQRMEILNRKREKPLPGPAKNRIKFTGAQRHVLHEAFRQTQRPPTVLIESLARELELAESTVINFFMNARRRSRNAEID